MTSPRPEQDAAPDTDMQATLAAAGIVSTPEGRERARRCLAEAAAKMTPERWEQVRTKYGIQPA